MGPTRVQTQAVAAFACLGSECPDTCCQGWGMQLTAETVAKYRDQAPELLEAVSSGEAEFIMKRDAETDRCVKFQEGWCGIHRQYGDAFLGDACHFFPRISRALGETVVTSAALSCPETARLMLYSDEGLAFTAREEMRTPYSLRNYLPEGMPEADALAVHAVMMDAAADTSVAAEHSVLRLSTVARALERQPAAVWLDATPLYISMADGRIPPAESSTMDMFHLAQSLYGLVMASPKPRPRLVELVDSVTRALGMTCSPQGGVQLAEDASTRAKALERRMQAQAIALQPVLRRYLQAQLSQALFPFSGFGTTLAERITIIGVRLATLKLALTTLPEAPAAQEVVRVVQVLSRFMDHLADPALSLQIYNETGWVREPRLRALLAA